MMRPKILLLILSFSLFYLLDHLSGAIAQLGRGKGSEGIFYYLLNFFVHTSYLIFLINAVLTYLLFYYLYPRTGTITTILIYLFFAVPAMIGLRFVMEEGLFFWITGKHNYNMKFVTPKFYLRDNIYFVTYYSMISIAFFGVQYERFSKMRKKELELQARNAELSFLKSQINPHFLFNNLNSIYTLIYHKSDNALPAVSKLSELLRYMLYQQDHLVLLTKEIGYLHNFIDLQLMRYDFCPQLNMSIQEGMDDGLTIIPLTLIPFVENAFKHGDLRDPDHPVCINIKVVDKWIHFHIRNKKNSMHRDETGGIGLENVRKRLELLKAGQFVLKVKENKDFFDVQLKMTANE